MTDDRQNISTIVLGLFLCIREESEASLSFPNRAKAVVQNLYIYLSCLYVIKQNYKSRDIPTEIRKADMRSASRLLIALGVIGIIAAFNMDVAIPGSSVVNIHLLSERQNYLIVSVGVFIAGIVLLVSAKNAGAKGDTETKQSIDAISPKRVYLKAVAALEGLWHKRPIQSKLSLNPTMLLTICCIGLSTSLGIFSVYVFELSKPGWAVTLVTLIHAPFAIAAIRFEVRHKHIWAAAFALLGAPTTIFIFVNVPWFWDTPAVAQCYSQDACARGEFCSDGKCIPYYSGNNN